MKKIATIAFALASSAVFAFGPGPHGGPGFHGGPGHHAHSFWGPGGSHFWPGFTGGLVGGLFGYSIARPLPPPVVYPAPVVVSQPVVVQQPQPVVVSQPVVVQQPQPVVVVH